MNRPADNTLKKSTHAKNRRSRAERVAPPPPERVARLMRETRDALITQWAEGRARVTRGPWLCYIGVTNLCNSRCGVCARARAMRPEKGIMDRATFRRVVDQLPASVSKVYLMKQGEPLVNPHLGYFVDVLRRKRPTLHLAFHTNGILATPARLHAMLPQLSSLGVSISAMTRETYRRVHGVDRFDTVMRNLQALSDWLVRRPPGRRPYVFIDYVVQRANRHEKEARVRDFFRARFPGLDSVDFHWVFNFQGEIAEGNLKVYEVLPHAQFPCCVFPWASITFLHDGKMDYCFVEPRENVFLGDITRQSFETLWRGAAFTRFRRRMAARQFGALAADGFYCHRCSWLWSMTSQSPRNLHQGYASRLREKEDPLQLGKLLPLPVAEMLALGAQRYLEGETHAALGIVDLVLTLSRERALRQAARQLRARCLRVLGQYRRIECWQRALQAEGLTADARTCRYHKNDHE